MTEGDTRLIIEDLFVGRVISVTAREAKVRLDDAHEAYGIHYNGFTYGAGEVGELLVFEGRSNLVVGQITSVDEEYHETSGEKRRVANASLLATACINSGNLKIGVSHFPRITARVFCVPVGYLKDLHEHTKDENDPEDGSGFARLGTLQNFNNIPFKISLSKLMSRHCGVFGATGGGKSYTAANLIEAIGKKRAGKVIIIDQTGEYENTITGSCSESNSDEWKVEFILLNFDENERRDRRKCETRSTLIPFNMLTNDALNFLFEPSEIQKPYFNDAIISLKIIELKNNYEKSSKTYQRLKLDSKMDGQRKRTIDHDEFNLAILSDQIREECFYVKDNSDSIQNQDSIALRNCNSLINKIHYLTSIKGDQFNRIFSHSSDLKNNPSNGSDESSVSTEIKINLKQIIEEFITDSTNDNVLYINLKHVPQQFKIKQLIVHLIGNNVYDKKSSSYENNLNSILLVVDEAHNLISPESKDISKEFNAFERIVREGRKIGLNLCLVTQCPRDLPEVVLNQLGTIIVHRLSGDHDRKLMERSCGDIDVNALSSLPILGTGQAVVLGTNFPIPVVVNVDKPENPPKLN